MSSKNNESQEVEQNQQETAERQKVEKARKDEKLNDLSRIVTSHGIWARLNYYAVYNLSLFAALSSFFAGLSVATNLFNTQIHAFLSTLPGFILLINDRLGLNDKSKWHWGKHYALRELYDISSVDDTVSALDIVTRWAEIDKEYEERWPGFGRGPQKSTARHH